MKCAELNRLLSPYIDGELDLQSALAVEAHLQECPRCSAAIAGVQTLRTAIFRACEPAKAPLRLREAVQAQFAAAPQQATSRSLGVCLAATPGIAALLIVGWLALAQPWNAQSSVGTAQGTRIVYHLAGGNHVKANLRTLKNHLDAEPNLQVVVVAHSDGINFLLQGAQDTEGQPYIGALRELRARGVEFRVCTNTLTRQQIDTRAVVPEAVLVPSGIAEISRLQKKEGYTYLRL
ncbi:MAG: DsrE family protein [Bradyrhizobium sp.]|uniref:zf-HC2 domain-containing protein n=1 Tax=Bradyrhizobium sp. TaxID=376 RepID=UPI002731D2A8|nr:zf-HC2 domain-containing protein [Bradyrhizobium sp.]MDP1864925.1 DsrE family protein [Bradyrhizobium sp.]